jgi:subtilisin family serine protease
MGAIVIAASGNDSNLNFMQLPANYDTVIGVAATNNFGGLSCYSNKGDLAAPGGDGGAINGLPCGPRASTWNGGNQPCTDEANCGYVLISLSSGPSGYILWTGTSFSTPLISGLAALTLERSGGARGKAICLIENGASVIQTGRSSKDPIIGWGIINVDKSLTSMACP